MIVRAWVCWPSTSGLSTAHYVGAPGTAPLCGWQPKGSPILVGVRSDRIAAPADATRCTSCARIFGAPG